MKSELFRMGKYPSMVKSMAFCAATFAFLSVIFKSGIVFIPEVTEVRICNMLSCCYGIWFGPAGAWGCAIGNLIGDLGGSLTVLSIPGFLANFASAWIPYHIWEQTGAALRESPLAAPGLHSPHWFLRYLLCGLSSVVTCSCILAVSFDWTGDMAAVNTFLMIFSNNFSAALLGIVLFLIMSCIPERILPYWRMQMREERRYAFSPRSVWVVFGEILAAAAILVFETVYMLTKGLGFSVYDGLHKPLPLLIFGISALLPFLLNGLCRRKEAAEDDIPAEELL